MISFLKHAFVSRGKYLAKNFCAKFFHVVTNLGGKEFNNDFALFYSENRKSLN